LFGAWAITGDCEPEEVISGNGSCRAITRHEFRRLAEGELARPGLEIYLVPRDAELREVSCAWSPAGLGP